MAACAPSTRRPIALRWRNWQRETTAVRLGPTSNLISKHSHFSPVAAAIGIPLMAKFFFPLRVAAAGLLAGILAGCGSGGPRTYQIPGKLTYEDGTPVPGASIVLQTHVKDQVIAARGMVQRDGQFHLTTFK